ncbi:MAG TPA: hypothetical protein VF008_00415 [Niastella sp.]
MKNRTVIFILFMAICVLIKVYFIAKDNPELKFNDDDQRNYVIAQNYVSGKGYGIYDPMVHRYRLSAFHTSSTVFLYQFFINQHVPQKTLVIAFYILSTLLYVLAVLYLYRLLNLLEISSALVYTATILFALYPSVMYSMGPKYHFDNLVMPLHIINFYFLLQWVKGRSLIVPVYIFLLVSITFCCFFRSQVLMLYFITGCILFFLYIKTLIKKKQPDNAMLYFLIALTLSISIAFIPVLIKNKQLFGAYIISTQAGFELLHGHNGINKGNWMISTPGDPLDRYVHEKIPFIETLDEYTESKARGRLAREWIKDNPGVEVKYIFKKMMRYFIPENAAPLKIKPTFYYHPLTILIHITFLITIFVSLMKNRKFLFSKEMLLLMTPVIATLLLSALFFFDMKLRYHAEPFLIIIAAYALDRYKKEYKSVNSILAKQNHH